MRCSAAGPAVLALALVGCNREAPAASAPKGAAPPVAAPAPAAAPAGVDEDLARLGYGSEAESEAAWKRAGDRKPADGSELIGTAAKEWTFTDWANGPERTLAELRGRVVVIRFWTTGCPFCEKSMPALQTLAEELRDEPVTFVGAFHAKPVDSVEDMSEPLALARRWGITFPLAFDRDWRTLRAWWLDGAFRGATSCTFVIGPDGRIVHVHPGVMYYPSDDPAAERENRDYLALRAAIRAALAP